jgi:hypothetical protein
VHTYRRNDRVVRIWAPSGEVERRMARRGMELAGGDKSRVVLLQPSRPLARVGIRVHT